MAVTAPRVKFETTVGDVVFELYYRHAPLACQNFLELSTRGYYNGTIFHRIIKDFMIQGKHTVFGRVFKGMKVVQRIGSVVTGKGDKPVDDVKILSASVVEPEDVEAEAVAAP